jgi:CRISPR-associated endonuclease/helicase Cas3
LRSAIEARLDAALNRRKPETVYQLPEIRAAIDGAPEKNHLFVVLGSPVTEVGRDHDYDWAVVEPSSMRSLIQLAGRVQRHREKICETPNIFIFDTNLRHFDPRRGSDGRLRAAFVRPGFEEFNALRTDHPFRLATHRLGKLLREDEYRAITARPRIQPRPPANWRPRHSLTDLEHARLFDAMAHQADGKLNAACAWQTPQAALTWILPQQQPFRDDGGLEETELVFLPDEGGEKLILHRVAAQKRGQPDLYVPEEQRLESIDLDALRGPRIAPWGKNDLLALLREQAEARDWSLHDCAKRFAVVSVLESTNGWRWHSALGFGRRK